jgi:hypothetical protein
VVVIGGMKTFELQYYSQNVVPTGLGFSRVNTGEVERYAQVVLEKLN